MSVQSHHRESQGPPRPAWAWGRPAEPPADLAAPEPEPEPRPEPEPVLAVATPEPEPVPVPTPVAAPPAPVAAASPLPEPPPYLGAPAPEPEGALARLVAATRGGTAGAVPVDRTANRVERVLVMALLVGGWALGLSSPRFELALLLVAVLLLAASAHPALSLARLISARVLPAARIGGPWYTAEDPAPHRLGEAVAGGGLMVAALCAVLGAPVAAWAIGWAVITVTLIEFTFDVSLGALVHGRLRRGGLLRV